MPYAETFKRSLERPDTLGVNSGLQRRVGSSSSTMSVLAVLSRARLASAFSLSSTRIARSGHHATRLVALAPLPQTRSYAKASKKSKGKGKGKAKVVEDDDPFRIPAPRPSASTADNSPDVLETTNKTVRNFSCSILSFWLIY